MKKIYAGDMTRLEFAERIKEAKCVIVTAGSCEQHGYHMALDTDNVLGHHMAMEAAKRCDAIVMPNINYGQVWSARKFPGSISLSNDTLKAVLKEIILSLESFGAKNILLLAGHNGNGQAMKDVARELVNTHDLHNVWYYTQTFSKELKGVLESPIPCNCVHAGEMETSMMLCVRPDLVDLSKAEKDFPELPAAAKYRPISWDEYITVGSYGDPSLATEEKGKLFLDAIIDEVVHLINDIM
ncbi:MAG: creatininase family protein [Erysipelotrichaceae bacterium]|nr:creatininase family protein [Erysipelotrichaceae bacterium]